MSNFVGSPEPNARFPKGLGILRGRFEYKWLVSLSVVGGTLMSVLDSTIVNVAIPRLRTIFHADLQSVQWIVTIYMITQAIVIPAAPTLIARFGTKRTWVWTLTAFLLGSILCGFAWNLQSLIVFRVTQGIGGGILLPMAMALTYQTYGIEERAKATSLMAMPVMFAPVLGPMLGGYLVERCGWPSIFLINIPLGVLTIVIAQIVLRDSPPQPKPQFDLAGFFAIACGSGLVLYAIATVPPLGLPVKSIARLMLGICLIAYFARLELMRARNGQNPLLDLRRFRDKTFSAGAGALMLLYALNFGVIFLIPQYLQSVRRFSALESGAIQSSLALTTLIVLPLAGWWSTRFGPRRIAMVGFIILVVTDLILTTLGLNSAVIAIVACMVLLGCAGGMSGQVSVLAMSNIERQEIGAVTNASTLLVVLRATGAPLGIALLTSVVQRIGQPNSAKFAHIPFANSIAVRLATLQGMHFSFATAATLGVIALLLLSNIPKNARQ
jgi:EmrB/QacA subfamily drug resistance transporter